MKHPLVLAAVLCGLIFSRPTGFCQEAAPSPVPAEKSAASSPVRGKAEHIVIVVWDGMRPDLIRDDTTPALAKLVREGTFFAHHHSVYPTSTEVNGTAIATGCFPGHSGIIGNREYRPDIDPLSLVATEALSSIRRGDEVSGGKYLAVPTLPELLQRAGELTMVAGTKPVAMLMDRAIRQPQEDTARQSATVAAGAAQPENIAKEIAKAEGAFPEDVHLPNTDADHWTEQALTEYLWHDVPPKLSVLWLSEPDFSQHQFGIASPNGLRALASSDAQLAAVLTALEKRGCRDKTDVLVVSDHGFSTIGQPVDVAHELVNAGLPAYREFKSPPKSGDILVDGLGGSVFLYVAGHDETMIRRVVDVLESSAFAGTIFTRQEGLPGTFPLNLAHINSPNAPDVVVALRWSDDKNAVGVPGTVVSDGGRKAGQGTHATFSRFDVHNTFVAAGPDFRAGATNDTPTSNADIAPTAAWILGLPVSSPMDGRVIKEALESSSPTVLAPPKTERLEAGREFESRHWQQYLQATLYDGETYLDEANGSSTSQKP